MYHSVIDDDSQPQPIGALADDSDGQQLTNKILTNSLTNKFSYSTSLTKLK